MEFYNSKSGKRVRISLKGISSLEELKAAVSLQQNIKSSDLLLLNSPSGSVLKSLDASRVFIYDKSWSLKPNKLKLNDNKNEEDNDSGGDQNPGDGDGEGKPELCEEGANVAIANLAQNLNSLSRQITKLKNGQSVLSDDITVCANWRRYYSALQQVPELSDSLDELLDVSTIEKNYEELASLWSKTSAEIEKIGENFANIKTGSRLPRVSESKSLADAQKKLIDTLQVVGKYQLKLKVDMKKSITEANSSIKRVEELKSKVARVIDLPFLYGVLLIESVRRQLWRKQTESVFARENQQRLDWRKRYSTGSIALLVDRLIKIGQFDFDKEEKPIGGESMNGTSENSEAAIMSYLQTLESLNLSDVASDLKEELNAMRRQLARNLMKQSATYPEALSLSQIQTQPDLLLLQSQQLPAPNDSAAGTGAMSTASASASASASAALAYQARIKKLENMLMQSRMGSKTQELDLIRAETRAEARAEARAEVKAEQQQARINELEKQNAELSSRLQKYVVGLEAVLNSIGLQTSRLDSQTGSLANTYKINRVKGISRHVSGPPKDGDSVEEPDQLGSSSGESAENPHDSGVSLNGPSASSGSSRTLSVERVLEQTYVDNQVLFEAVNKRFGDVERLARRLQVENRRYHDRDIKMQRILKQRVALHSFRAEDLILFLPTRDNQRQPNPWAAFNAGAPHYFLHPKHTEQLQNREYLIARAASIERHVAANDDENIFQLPAGVEWFLITIHGEWVV